METYGHSLYLDEQRLRTRLERQRQIFARYCEDKPSMEEVVIHGDGEECGNCGRYIYYGLDETDSIVPLWQAQSLAEHRATGAYQRYPAETPCAFANVKTVTVPFTCRSGRIAVGNDFRKHFPNHPESTWFSINNLAGKIQWIQAMASIGYLTGFVGNTSIDFVPRGAGLDVMSLSEPGLTRTGKRSRSKRAKLIRADQKASVHQMYTELWWFAIVDAADLPANATDSYDRKIGFMDLPKGDYEMTYNVNADRYSDYVTYAWLRKLSEG